MGIISQFCHEQGRSFLEARRLTKTYQVGGSTVYALRDVDFRVEKQRFST